MTLSLTRQAWLPILLLIGSNVFMTFAWYGHLRFRSATLATAVIISWGIALFEYCLQVPANRLGYGYYTAAQLKTIQEIVTLSVFVVFSIFYLSEPIRWNVAVGFALMIAAAFFIFHKWA